MIALISAIKSLQADSNLNGMELLFASVELSGISSMLV